MQGLIGGLVLWGYVLAGVIVVLLGTVALTAIFETSRGKAILISAAGWYLGAPGLVLLFDLHGKWTLYRANEEYLELCRKNAIESGSTVSRDIELIKLDTGAREHAFPRSPADAFGPGYRSRLFGSLDDKSGRGPGMYRNYDFAPTPSSRFLIVKVRSTDVIPYVGTFYATAVDLEVVDPSSMATLAHRRTFTRGFASHASALDCDRRNLHQANLKFLQSVITPNPAASR